MSILTDISENLQKGKAKIVKANILTVGGGVVPVDCAAPVFILRFSADQTVPATAAYK